MNDIVLPAAIAAHVPPPVSAAHILDSMSDEQRTELWHLMRAGRFTGSKFCDVIARNVKTGEPLKAYHDLIWTIITERLSGQPVEGPRSKTLDWGTDLEPFALEAVQTFINRPVQTVGFIVHPEFDFAGASPDGLIDAKGGLEIKCPANPGVHLSRFVNGMEKEHLPQVQGAMWVTGRDWWLFASFDPRMPKTHQLYLQKIDRDPEFIAKMQAMVIEAEDLVQQRMAALAETVKAAAKIKLPPRPKTAQPPLLADGTRAAPSF